LRIVVAVTGASGVVYGYDLLKALKGNDVSLILSEDAKTVIKEETDITAKDFERTASRAYRNDDMAAPVSSGSNRLDAMVIVPCSGTTLSKIAVGIADNLITRTAAVFLKERRKLVLVPRETPVSPISLENMLKLSRLGVVILPASPGFYAKPKSAQDLVDFVVARIMDQLGLKQKLLKGWKAELAPPSSSPRR
jgi:4-hydroxy-3-polyprenylbenzoate decarboxylase